MPYPLFDIKLIREGKTLASKGNYKFEWTLCAMRLRATRQPGCSWSHMRAEVEAKRQFDIEWNYDGSSLSHCHNVARGSYRLDLRDWAEKNGKLDYGSRI